MLDTIYFLCLFIFVKFELAVVGNIQIDELQSKVRNFELSINTSFQVLVTVRKMGV